MFSHKDNQEYQNALDRYNARYSQERYMRIHDSLAFALPHGEQNPDHDRLMNRLIDSCLIVCGVPAVFYPIWIKTYTLMEFSQISDFVLYLVDDYLSYMSLPVASEIFKK